MFLVYDAFSIFEECIIPPLEQNCKISVYDPGQPVVPNRWSIIVSQDRFKQKRQYCLRLKQQFAPCLDFILRNCLNWRAPDSSLHSIARWCTRTYKLKLTGNACMEPRFEHVSFGAIFVIICHKISPSLKIVILYCTLLCGHNPINFLAMIGLIWFGNSVTLCLHTRVSIAK